MRKVHLKCALWRTVEVEGSWALQNTIPGDSIDFSLLEEFVEETKSSKQLVRNADHLGYHFLIYTPFRYDPPVPPERAARFRPPHSMKNVFYGAKSLEVSIFESSFYFMKERKHLSHPTGSAEPRLAFSVNFEDVETLDISSEPNISEIMSKQNDYKASHSFILEHPCESILYPSARHPNGHCVACFEIRRLGKEPLSREQFRFIYDKRTESCEVIDDAQRRIFLIPWTSVS